METTLIEAAGERTYVIVFAAGDEVMSGLKHLAQERGMTAAHFTAIGAFSDATLAYFDWAARQYVDIPVPEQVEVLSLAGDVALKNGQPEVHAHVVVGVRDGTTRGGHLMRARVRPTLELVLTESPTHLQRRYDPSSGLALIDLGASSGAVVPRAAA